MNTPIKITTTGESLKAPAIIAISGFGGAGKSTFANSLGNEMDIPIIRVDSFFLGFDITNYSKWKCFDFARLENEVCLPLLKGNKQISYSEFDWENNSSGKMNKIVHRGKIIIEGVGLFRPELINYFSHDQYWDGIWRRNDEEYWSIYKPKEIAHDIIQSN